MLNELEHLIDIAHGGIVDGRKILTRATVGVEALNNDLGRFAPIGMIAPSFRTDRRSTAFGFSLTKSATVETNQNQSIVGTIRLAKGDTLTMVHGLLANGSADALNGFDAQLDAMPGKCLPGDFERRA